MRFKWSCIEQPDGTYLSTKIPVDDDEAPGPETVEIKRGRGRPRGPNYRPNVEHGKRGRKKGSKNKPKDPPAPAEIPEPEAPPPPPEPPKEVAPKPVDTDVPEIQPWPSITITRIRQDVDKLHLRPAIHYSDRPCPTCGGRGAPQNHKGQMIPCKGCNGTGLQPITNILDNPNKMQWKNGFVNAGAEP